MRYIFIEGKNTQTVYDIDTVVWYAVVTLDNLFKVSVEGINTSGYFEFTRDRAISFWKQLAKQVDGRCGIEDARKRMEAFIESATND